MFKNTWIRLGCNVKINHQKLQNITDTETLFMTESGIRNGLTDVTHRYTKANNKYLPDYDPSKPSLLNIFR